MVIFLTGLTKRTSYLINSICDLQVVNCSIQVARDQPTTYLPVVYRFIDIIMFYRLFKRYYRIFSGYLQDFHRF